jgi:hypothetical protein
MTHHHPSSLHLPNSTVGKTTTDAVLAVLPVGLAEEAVTTVVVLRDDVNNVVVVVVDDADDANDDDATTKEPKAVLEEDVHSPNIFPLPVVDDYYTYHHNHLVYYHRLLPLSDWKWTPSRDFLPSTPLDYYRWMPSALRNVDDFVV